MLKCEMDPRQKETYFGLKVRSEGDRMLRQGD